MRNQGGDVGNHGGNARNGGGNAGNIIKIKSL